MFTRMKSGGLRGFLILGCGHSLRSVRTYPLFFNPWMQTMHGPSLPLYLAGRFLPHRWGIGLMMFLIEKKMPLEGKRMLQRVSHYG